MNSSLDSLSNASHDPVPVRRIPAWIVPLAIVAGFALLFLALFRDRLLPAVDVKVALVLATIRRRAIDLGTEPQLKPYVDLPRMATMSLEMLRDAITAFINRDTEKARAVVPRDSDVDNLNRQLHRELSSYMVERPSNISRCLHLMVISKSLERIADHATNIAQEVVYLYEAKDIRHTAGKANETENPNR